MSAWPVGTCSLLAVCTSPWRKLSHSKRNKTGVYSRYPFDTASLMLQRSSGIDNFNAFHIRQGYGVSYPRRPKLLSFNLIIISVKCIIMQAPLQIR